MIEKKYQEEVTAENPVERYFKVMSGAEWMVEANSMPLRKKLAGDLWFEGENAVLFADTNAGKSILAVQIADSISRGVAIDPLELTAVAQPVIYFDFEMEAPQFRRWEDGWMDRWGQTDRRLQQPPANSVSCYLDRRYLDIFLIDRLEISLSYFKETQR